MFLYDFSKKSENITVLQIEFGKMCKSHNKNSTICIYLYRSENSNQAVFGTFFRFPDLMLLNCGKKS